jgi:hypothetical protein
MEIGIDYHHNEEALIYLAANPSDRQILFNSWQSSAELLKACINSQVNELVFYRQIFLFKRLNTTLIA